MHKRNGISTIGVMLAIVVIALLAYIILPQLANPDKARIVQAKKDITTIMAALENYKSDNGFYPSDDQGLQALVHEPDIAPIPHNWAAYLTQLPTDPWGNDYQYENDNGLIHIWSYGPGGKNGKTPVDNTTK